MGRILIFGCAALMVFEAAAALAEGSAQGGSHVDVTFSEGARAPGSQTVRFRMPLPAENESAQAQLYEGPFTAPAYPRYRVIVTLRVELRKAASGQSQLHYDVERRAVQEGGGKDIIPLVEAHGALALPQNGPVVVVERAVAGGPTAVTVEVSR